MNNGICGVTEPVTQDLQNHSIDKMEISGVCRNPLVLGALYAERRRLVIKGSQNSLGLSYWRKYGLA